MTASRLRKSIALTSVAALLCVAPACAGAAQDGPGHAFEDDLIKELAGTWDLTRSIRGREERNTVEARWVLQHQFLRIHMQDAAVPPKYEAYVYVGYSNTDRSYVIHWMDTWGGHYAGTGKGTRSGDSIEFRLDGDPPFFNTFAYDRASDTWSMKLENGSASGTRTPFATDRLRRTR